MIRGTGGCLFLGGLPLEGLLTAERQHSYGCSKRQSVECKGECKLFGKILEGLGVFGNAAGAVVVEDFVAVIGPSFLADLRKLDI